MPVCCGVKEGGRSCGKSQEGPSLARVGTSVRRRAGGLPCRQADARSPSPTVTPRFPRLVPAPMYRSPYPSSAPPGRRAGPLRLPCGLGAIAGGWSAKAAREWKPLQPTKLRRSCKCVYRSRGCFWPSVWLAAAMAPHPCHEVGLKPAAGGACHQWHDRDWPHRLKPAAWGAWWSRWGVCAAVRLQRALAGR